MNPKERAQELRKEGLTYDEVSAGVGASLSTVYRWVNPGKTAAYRNGRAIDPERARAMDREHYRKYKKGWGRCSRCNGEMSRDHDGGTCESCRSAAIDARAKRIEGWWAEGLLMREIAAELNWSKERIALEIHRLRGKGYNLPYRNKIAV